MLQEPINSTSVASSSSTGYVEATQDGLVRLFRKSTPEYVTGLYTEGLQTCVAIIFAGQKGFSLIHDSGKLEPGFIQKEASQLGTIAFWGIGYRYDTLCKSEFLEEKKDYYINLMSRVGVTKSPMMYSAPDGFISISRQGIVNSTKKPTTLIFPRDKQKRHDINYVNNFFCVTVKPFISEKMPPDVQFDGEKFTTIPKLMKTPQEVEQIFREYERYRQPDNKYVKAVRYAVEQYERLSRITLNIDKLPLFGINNLADIAQKLNRKYITPIEEFNRKDEEQKKAVVDGGAASKEQQVTMLYQPIASFSNRSTSSSSAHAAGNNMAANVSELPVVTGVNQKPGSL